MPLVRITMSKKVDEEKKQEIMQDLTKKLSMITGKPEKYMMMIFEPEKNILFGSSNTPSAFLEIKSIGSLNPENTKKITEEFCVYFASNAGIDEERLYIEFEDVKPEMWGWNSKTFG
ncbi:MAG: tautomerase family protein [Candidatus Aureabacteria bacterium]|nr:tautomerase family protein [Candidatus Auribacterota bacterium]